MAADGVSAARRLPPPRRSRPQPAAVFAVDERGISPEPISSLGPEVGLRSPEDVTFFPDGRHLVVVNQDSDSALIIGMDPATGQLGSVVARLRNPEAGLSFPHGCSVSPDGRYLAIGKYGDDKCAVYATRAQAPRLAPTPAGS